jgi:hypothetical protein
VGFTNNVTDIHATQQQRMEGELLWLYRGVQQRCYWHIRQQFADIYMQLYWRIHATDMKGSRWVVLLYWHIHAFKVYRNIHVILLHAICDIYHIHANLVDKGVQQQCYWHIRQQLLTGIALNVLNSALSDQSVSISRWIYWIPLYWSGPSRRRAKSTKFRHELCCCTECPDKTTWNMQN